MKIVNAREKIPSQDPAYTTRIDHSDVDQHPDDHPRPQDASEEICHDDREKQERVVVRGEDEVLGVEPRPRPGYLRRRPRYSTLSSSANAGSSTNIAYGP